ncbi:hypothetical protein JCM17846_33330 [Iodidimonas nitroreducens]|uniref:Calcineurin-like phosphoesterase domain-containing protein n=1 Tax=Iodidimonas nitroreducens TaxID=1236968 RepID=A0A5A7NB95_9PROT|nr:metallophosphoesterase [Iodidimonas nitroreducens]GER05651.1 hypothetical protein JCM17846_33330 [Iodidimonas nitroreducens]
MTQAAIAFIGDPHGQWDDIRHQIEQQLDQGVAIAAIVPVGDMELERPLHEELALFLDMGIAVHWIHGNHDSDHAHWHDHLFGSRLQDKTLHALVKEIEGTKLAGLGGVFRGEIWFPQPREAPARFPTRTGFVDNLDHHKRWRKGLPLKHRTSIFPEDFARLEQQESADILVCHEGPSTVVKDSTGR